MPWRKKIARIDCQFAGATNRGTGFLVAPDRVLTAHHVLVPPAGVAGPPHTIEAAFLDAQQQPNEVRRATCVPGAADARPDRDWVLLALDQPVQEAPFRLAELTGAPAQDWYSYGFPADAKFDGLSLTGKIVTPGVVHELGCTEVAFSKEGAEGASGAPCIVGERVVGLIQFALPKGAAGRLFATSAATLAEHADLRPYFRAPPPFLREIEELLKRSARPGGAEPPIEKVREVAQKMGVPTAQITSEPELRRALAWRIAEGGHSTLLACLVDLLDADLDPAAAHELAEAWLFPKWMPDEAVAHLERYTFTARQRPGAELNTDRAQTTKRYLNLARRERSRRIMKTISVSNIGGADHEADLLLELRAELCKALQCKDGELEQRLTARTAQLGPIVIMVPRPRPSEAFFRELAKLRGAEHVRVLAYTEHDVAPEDTHLELICPPIDPATERDAENQERAALAEIAQVLQS